MEQSNYGKLFEHTKIYKQDQSILSASERGELSPGARMHPKASTRETERGNPEQESNQQHPDHMVGALTNSATELQPQP